MDEKEKLYLIAIMLAVIIGAMYGVSLMQRANRDLLSLIFDLDDEIKALRAQHVPHPE